MPGKTLTYSLGLLLVLAACGASSEEELDPTATYEAFGHPFEPAAAVPAQAVLSEPESYLGRSVMIEGTLVDECKAEPCWMLMRPDREAGLRILMPRFPIPDDIAGQRVVVHGRLAAADDGTYNLHPTGVMVEKVRS